ncbi:MAG: Cell division protein FtsZ [Ramlibacter sp.]|nr:Cell division protein FtsZ [Ramlibacter sp.]
MSGFTLGVALLGGVVLASLVGYNAWISRRNSPRQPLVAGAAEGPAGAGESRRDPVFDSEPTLPPIEKKPAIDALIDAIAPIAVEGVVTGDAAIAALPPTRRAGSKPFAIEGLNESTQQWEPPRPGLRYTAFQAGVQLANRTGHLNEIEFSEFVMKAQQFADAINGSPDFPDMINEVARGRELDQFAGDHDAQLSITLRAKNTAWSPGYVHQGAARLGFVPGVIPGRLVMPATTAGSPPILVISFDTQAALADDPTQSALREFTLSLDVPQVHRSEQPFVRMRDAAIALAASMEGIIADDKGEVIRADALDLIGSHLEKLYDVLEAHDLAAGSAQARRLFS